MSEALVGLIGAVIGGLLTAGTTAAFERRRDARERRMALRLVLDAIISAEAQLRVALDKCRWTGLDFRRDAGGLAPLAKALGDRDWKKLSDATALIQAVQQTYVTQPRGLPLSASEQDWLWKVVEMAQEARILVARALHLGPEAEPASPADLIMPMGPSGS